MKKIGIMGGTFDPIHYGHLVTAEEAREKFHLDKVVFVPSGIPPHKKRDGITLAQHRCAMIELAIATNPYFTLSKVEIERKGFSYAADTVDAFLTHYGKDTELYFITGADAIQEIMSWHKIDELINKCYFIAATRPGHDLESLLSLPSPYKEKIQTLNVTALAISSSQIRSLRKKDQTIKYLLPETSEAYLLKYHLYKGKHHD